MLGGTLTDAAARERFNDADHKDHEGDHHEGEFPAEISHFPVPDPW
jgi:hypothetical protein